MTRVIPTDHAAVARLVAWLRAGRPPPPQQQAADTLTPEPSHD